MRNGRQLSPSDAEWLARYEATRKRRGPKPASTSNDDEGWEPIRQRVPEAPPPPMPPSSHEGGGVALSGPVCTIENCSACRGTKGAQRCAVTGKLVWPPMTEGGSQMLATALLLGLSALARMFRKDGKTVMPTNRERDDLALALKEVAERRASWLGAGDDLGALLFFAWRYGQRAISEGARAPQQAQAAS